MGPYRLSPYVLVTDSLGAIVRQMVLPDPLAALYTVAGTESGMYMNWALNLPNFYRPEELVRLDSLGRVLWRVRYTGADTLAHTIGLVSFPGGVLRLGYDHSSSLGTRALVARYNGAGQEQWRWYGGHFVTGGVAAALPDGSYAVVYSDPTRLSGAYSYYSTDHRLVRLSPQGIALDSAWVVLPDAYDRALAVKPTIDGGLLLVGTTSPRPFSTPRKGILIKLDSAWQEQWRYTITQPWGDNDSGALIRDVWETTSGHLVVLAGQSPTPGPRTVSGQLWQELVPPTTAGSVPTVLWSWRPADIWGGIATILYAPDGTVRMFGTTTVGGPTVSEPDPALWRLGNLPLPAPVDLCAVGVTLGPAGYQRLNGRIDSLVFTLDSAATLPGARYADISRVWWDFGDGTPVAEGFRVAHRFASPAPVRVRVCAASNLSCQACTDVFPYGVPTVGLPAAVAAPAVQVWPNPSADGRFTVQVAGAQAESAEGGRPGTLTVLDGLGRVVTRQPLTAATTALDLRAQAAGVYTLRLTWPTAVPVTRQLVVGR